MVVDTRLARLRDGRTLAYAVIGDPDGAPILYCHGFPGSRLEPSFADATARRMGVCLIAPDRPGMGESDFRPGRALLDWPSNVAELADALGIERCPLLGLSGGGPYAAACALRIPERLSAIGIVSGLAPLAVRGVTRGGFPPTRLGLGLARTAPWLARPVLASVAPIVRRAPERIVRGLEPFRPEADRRVLAQPEIGGRLARSFAESFRAGARGPAWDVRILSGPWGFELGEIDAPVLLWHGGADVVTPPPMGEAYASGLRRCTPRWKPDDGHFSLIVRHIEEILSALTGRA